MSKGNYPTSRRRSKDQPAESESAKRDFPDSSQTGGGLLIIHVHEFGDRARDWITSPAWDEQKRDTTDLRVPLNNTSK